MTHIVGADHHHEDLRMIAFELSVVETPKHIFGLVGDDAEIERLMRGINRFPGFLSHAPPAVGDGIAHQHDFPSASLCEGDVAVHLLHPGCGLWPGCRRGGNPRSEVRIWTLGSLQAHRLDLDARRGADLESLQAAGNPERAELQWREGLVWHLPACHEIAARDFWRIVRGGEGGFDDLLTGGDFDLSSRLLGGV